MNNHRKIYAPGARILVRDAEWMIRRVGQTSTGGYSLHVVGLSELVRDKEAVFLTEIDRNIIILDPADTKIVQDTTSKYRASVLYLESMLRKTPPTDENLYIGYKAAMDSVKYQLPPAIQSLQQPRQRILIADAVGLGKTLEAGILLSELIRRGRGKRILVLAVKSMLTQFQKEMWSRFTIPLTRLDSIGVQRIRREIPSNHNPFYYYDKTIISIDTLKQDSEYRNYLENAYWDIIVIDEAHNVAKRNDSISMRAKLADLLSKRSDTLIMLSATPHDGKARSFASLMNMLNPTAITDPENYKREDIKGLFIRRFKKDIQNQVQNAFKDRKIAKVKAVSSEIEENCFAKFVNLKFKRLNQKRGSGILFKTSLEKGLFSSPTACIKSIDNRIAKLTKEENEDYVDDIQKLSVIKSELLKVTSYSFSKYQRLIKLIKDDIKWTGKKKDDRLVIFTERIETMNFLKKNLLKDLNLKNNQVETLCGTMSDINQQEIVENFGKDESPIRLLIASDVASEGINLHYLCHRMIHFDIPWSLMVFQQRNGRIDRYGQVHVPEIYYLTTQSTNKKIKGDTRILELLIEKDQQAYTNIGDPSIFMGAFDIDSEELMTAKVIESDSDTAAEEFDTKLEKNAKEFDPLAALEEGPPPTGEDSNDKICRMPSLLSDDYSYLSASLSYLKENENIHYEEYPEESRIDITANKDLEHRLKDYPKEISANGDVFSLTTDVNTIKDEIRNSRKDESAWPRIQYLWELHPVVEWINDKLLSSFRRHEAPLIVLDEGLLPNETVFIMYGLVPNIKGHTLVHNWFGVSFIDNKFSGKIDSFEKLLERTGLAGNDIPNRGIKIETDRFESLLPEAVEHAKVYMKKKRDDFEDYINPKLDKQLKALDELRKKRYAQLEIDFKDLLQQHRKSKQKREIDSIFDEYIDWIEQTMTTEENAYIKVAAVLANNN